MIEEQLRDNENLLLGDELTNKHLKAMRLGNQRKDCKTAYPKKKHYLQQLQGPIDPGGKLGRAGGHGPGVLVQVPGGGGGGGVGGGGHWRGGVSAVGVVDQGGVGGGGGCQGQDKGLN